MGREIFDSSNVRFISSFRLAEKSGALDAGPKGLYIKDFKRITAWDSTNRRCAICNSFCMNS